ncbi:hypothetical protein HY994_02615 [Candidatus Micrarchaeota archaeon]|nr:hypothetical protein [Candidatus Micrarchaeota archaeon]
MMTVGNPNLHAVLSEDVTRGGLQLEEADSCDFSKFRNGEKLEMEFKKFVAIMNQLKKDHVLMHDPHLKFDGPNEAFQKTFYIVHNPKKPKTGQLVMTDVDHVFFTGIAYEHPVIGPALKTLETLQEDAGNLINDEPRAHPRFTNP